MLAWRGALFHVFMSLRVVVGERRRALWCALALGSRSDCLRGAEVDLRAWLLKVVPELALSEIRR